MITRMQIRNFKVFDHAEIDLAKRVVFVGPNDSGKTSALQALALWHAGVRKWLEKRGGRETPAQRPGVTVNRLDLTSTPMPSALLLWRDLDVRSIFRDEDGKQRTNNVYIEITVQGVEDSGEGEWSCGLEFYYANPESFYCRPLLLPGGDGAQRMAVPEHLAELTLAFLPPMSGLAAEEARLDPGRIEVMLGQGRTAEVLRNMCLRVAELDDSGLAWESFTERVRRLFGVKLHRPQYVQERGEIRMGYRNQQGIELDLASSGRGMQQTMLLLAFLASHPGAVLLLDEPDAHLEVLRQRQTYEVLAEAADDDSSQVIIASHSEVILNEAAARDVVVAFVGRPHRIDDQSGRGSQVRKSLAEVGFDQYLQAEEKGWVLYLEGSTDLAILRGFAASLDHPASADLSAPFVKYVGNDPPGAYHHFYALREAKDDLCGYALFDRLGKAFEMKPGLEQHQWSRCEIENYLCMPEALVAWAESEAGVGTLFASGASDGMLAAIAEVEQAALTLGEDPWSPDVKVSEKVLLRRLRISWTRVCIASVSERKVSHGREERTVRESPRPRGAARSGTALEPCPQA